MVHKEPRPGRRSGRLLAIVTAFWLVLPGVSMPIFRAAPPSEGPSGAAAARSMAASSPSASIPRPSPVQAGPAPDLVIFYEGEVLGWTEPCG